MCKPIKEEMLPALQAAVKDSMSPYRFAHTEGVAQTVAELAALFEADATALQAAALLHDVTKEWSAEKALAYLAENGISLRPDERVSPKVYHGITAVPFIQKAYAPYATPTVLSAVRWHTTGRDGMTLEEALLYLADYIEPGRRFDDCVALRKAFFDAPLQAMSMAERQDHLWQILLQSFDYTLAALAAEGAPVCADTLAARAYVAKKIIPRKEPKDE